MTTDSRKMISLICLMIKHWIFTRFPNNPYAEARQFAVAFPGKSTSLSLTIHRNRNLSQFVQEFLGWRFSADHVGQV